MKRFVPVLFMLCMGLGIPVAGSEVVKKVVEPLPTDLDRIQGTWKVVGISCPAVFGEGQKDVTLEYRFKGTSYQVIRNGKLFRVGSFKLFTASGKKMIDMTEFDSPLSSKGELLPGIYSLKGDNLVMVHSFSNPKDRPITFDPKNRDNGITYLKRVKTGS